MDHTQKWHESRKGTRVCVFGGGGVCEVVVVKLIKIYSIAVWNIMMKLIMFNWHMLMKMQRNVQVLQALQPSTLSLRKFAYGLPLTLILNDTWCCPILSREDWQESKTAGIEGSYP